jgi:hypothetical protein
MRRAFRETPIFTEKLNAVGDDDLLRSIEDAILENPEAGATVAGTGGVRKLRAPDPSRGKGKRGGLRILYLDLPDKERTYLLYLYGKNEAEDLTTQEKKIFKELVAEIKGESK